MAPRDRSTEEIALELLETWMKWADVERRLQAPDSLERYVAALRPARAQLLDAVMAYTTAIEDAVDLVMKDPNVRDRVFASFRPPS